jgi:hypothetical protein
MQVIGPAVMGLFDISPITVGLTEHTEQLKYLPQLNRKE